MANVSKFKVPNGTTYTIKDSTARSDATTAKTLATSAMNNIATIQTSSTASKAYSVGDYLVLNNQLYEVTTAIASGETLTVGTNISATKVGDELTSLNNSLMQVMRPTLLWSGDKNSSGSITVNGLSEWFIIAIQNYATADYLLIGTASRGGTVYGMYQSGNTTTFGYRFTQNGDVLTIDSNNRGITYSGHSTYSGDSSDCHIRAIYGLFKKPQS